MFEHYLSLFVTTVFIENIGGTVNNFLSVLGRFDVSGNVDGVELEDFDRFSKLMGFEDVWEFENKWSDF